MCTIVFAVKFRYILTYRKPYIEILYGKTPFFGPPPPPGGPTKFFLQMGKSRPRDESNKKNLKSLAGLEAEISMEQTDGRRTDGRTEMRAYKRYHYRGLR